LSTAAFTLTLIFSSFEVALLVLTDPDAVVLPFSFDTFSDDDVFDDDPSVFVSSLGVDLAVEVSVFSVVVLDVFVVASEFELTFDDSFVVGLSSLVVFIVEDDVVEVGSDVGVAIAISCVLIELSFGAIDDNVEDVPVIEVLNSGAGAVEVVVVNNGVGFMK
jgi:hypothetical protein